MNSKKYDEKSEEFKYFYTLLQSIFISNNDELIKYVSKYLKLCDHFTITQNLIILEHLESKCMLEAFIYSEKKNSFNSKFKFLKLVLSIIRIIQTTELCKYITKNFIKFETILNALMLYSVKKSLEQFNLFKLNYGDDYKILNNEMFNDEINLIEL